MVSMGLLCLIWLRYIASSLVMATLAVPSCWQSRALLESAAGVARGLSEIAAERGVVFQPHTCASVDGSRVAICQAELSAPNIETLRTALLLEPFTETSRAGPAFGKSRCLDQAPPGALALVTGFPWIANKHFRYLLIVVPAEGGKACVETEEGYG